MIQEERSIILERSSIGQWGKEKSQEVVFVSEYYRDKAFCIFISNCVRFLFVGLDE
jgi:predicted KAP-like P-loop ATPase